MRMHIQLLVYLDTTSHRLVFKPTKEKPSSLILPDNTPEGLLMTRRCNLKNSMGPEAKLYKKIKKTYYDLFLGFDSKTIALLGTPDLLGYNNSGVFFTVELKVTKGNKVRFSPHQIAFHVKHPHNTFICIEAPRFGHRETLPWF